MGPTLRCLELPIFDSADLSAARAAFAASEACPLGQTWREAPDRLLRPASARLGWRGELLHVLIECVDDDVFTRAQRLNQRTWELGDCVEIFLEPRGAQSYYEFHVAPNEALLQMRVPIPRPAGVEPERFMLEGRLFDGRAWKAPGGWTALASIPFSSCGGRPERFSVSRYDYTRGRAHPVHSSTSPHAELDFHRRQEWGRLLYP